MKKATNSKSCLLALIQAAAALTSPSKNEDVWYDNEW